MNPDQLQAESFASYPPEARQFAANHLSLLRRLPLAACPSFLKQVLDLDTSFPAERMALAWQCHHLQALPEPRFSSLVAVLSTISLPQELRVYDWVHDPAGFVTILAAHLWSSGQLDRFRAAAQALFAAIPPREDTTGRFAVVVASKELKVPDRTLFRKLSKQGTVLKSFDHASAREEIQQLLLQRAAASKAGYAHWYVDGGEPWTQLPANADGLLAASYEGLAPLRRRVLERMERALTGSNGAEQMRDRLFGTSPQQVGIGEVTADPVLQRFYTELFTQSSGPQIFSTSFVQWNELFADNAPNTPDLPGSFQDAEMGAYYNWLEMKRITAPGKLTFVALVEDHPFAVVVGRNAPAGAVSATPMTFREALRNFA